MSNKEHPSFKGKSGMQLRNSRRKSARRKRQLRTLLLVASLCLFVAAAIMLVNYIRMTRTTVETQSELKEAYNQATESPTSQAVLPPLPLVSYSPVPAAATPTPREVVATQIAQQMQVQAVLTPEPAMADKFVSLYKKNKDVIGWLKLESVQEIDFPITKRDNFFYVDHDFYGRKSAAGTAFLDVSCSVLPKDENMIIHAHNMKNGTMFGKLNHLLNIDTFKQKPLASFDTLYEQGEYVPYAVSIVSIEPNDAHYFPIIEPSFLADADRVDYVEALVEFSAFNIPVDVLLEDELLALVTCHGNEKDERLVVGYRKLREGETSYEMEEAIRKGTTKR